MAVSRHRTASMAQRNLGASTISFMTFIPFSAIMISTFTGENARGDSSLEGLINEANRALQHENANPQTKSTPKSNSKPNSKSNAKSGSRSDAKSQPNSNSAEGESLNSVSASPTPAAVPAPNDGQRKAEEQRQTELSKVFAIEKDQRAAPASSDLLGIDFGLIVGLQVEGGMGLHSTFSHEEDTFSIETVQPLVGIEVSAAKSIFDLVQLSPTSWARQKSLDLALNLAVGIYQGDVTVEQHGIQERSSSVTHRLLQTHGSLFAQKIWRSGVKAGIGLGAGVQALNQIGTGISDSFFNTNIAPVGTVSIAYAMRPGWDIECSVRRFGFQANTLDRANSLTATTGMLVRF